MRDMLLFNALHTRVDDLDQAGKPGRFTISNELTHNLISAFISEIYVIAI